MIKKFFKKISLIINPIKRGDVFYGNPTKALTIDFVEKSLYGLKDNAGNPILEPIPSQDCYRLTVESTAMPTYYRCKSELLCRKVSPSSDADHRIGVWMERKQPRRIFKKVLEKMVIEGTLIKELE